MTSDRIKEIQKTTASPDSVSVQQALLQVWNECSQLPAVTDEQIDMFISEVDLCQFNNYYEAIRFGITSYRDGLIPSSGNTVKEEEKESMKGFIESVKQITENTPELNMSNYDHDQVHILNEALLEIYALSHQFDHPISSAPDIKQGKEDTACDNCGHQNCNDCTVLSNE